MSKNKDPLAFLWADNQLLASVVFRQLTKTSLLALHTFMKKKRVRRPSRGRNWVVINNGEIQFTYREAEKMGISRASFMRAIDQLSQLGFLYVKKQGSGLQGDCSLYGISTEWRNFGTKKFNPSPRKKRGDRYRFPKRGRGQH